METTTFRTPEGAPTTLADAALDDLARSVRGAVLTAGTPAYDEARRVWNGMIDRHPGAIVRCSGRDDVVAAVRFAREQGVAVSVRGGGHNVAGSAVTDGGLMIDLAAMRTVEVDPALGRVRAAGGATIGDVDAASQEHGLAVPLGVASETGIAGLTLGGGYGWLRAAHGLTCDNLVAAEVVTASGDVVTAGDGGDPELLWGLRGGGGNFGIVTEFTWRAHPVGPEVFFAATIHAARDAASAVAFLRDWAPSAAPEVSTIGVIGHGPPVDDLPAAHHGEPVVILLAMHSGDAAEGERGLAPLREFGQPVADWSAAMPFTEVQQFFDEDYPKWEKRYYWKSAHVGSLPDELIDALLEVNRRTPSPDSTIDVWPNTGAATRPPADGAALDDRSAPFMLGVESNWDDPDDDDANLAWAREAVDAAGPWATGARYLNFPGHYEEQAATMAATFGAGLDRLGRLKATYDPTNLFRGGHNIAPAEGEAAIP